MMHRRASYTVDFKLRVVEWTQSNGRSLRAAAKQFGIDRKCVRQWTKERDTLSLACVSSRGSHKRKLHKGRCPLSQELDGLVLGYYLEECAKRTGEAVGTGGRKVSDAELKAKALQVSQMLGYPEFKASTSWLKGWKHRNSVTCESASDTVRLTQTPGSTPETDYPLWSSLISHVTTSDEVAIPPLTSAQHRGDDDIDSDATMATVVDGTMTTIEVETLATKVLPSAPIELVPTPDHTYSTTVAEETIQLLAEDSFTTQPPPPSPPSLYSSTFHSLLVSRTYKDFLDGSLHDEHPSRSHAMTAPTLPHYYTVQSAFEPATDPIMGCTLVEDVCDFDISLEHEEVVITGEDGDNVFCNFSPSSSSGGSSLVPALSSPRRTSPVKSSKLWPTLGCSRTSPVTLTGVSELPDPLTGLLGNRLSQPVFPAGPKILCWDVPSSTFTQE